MAKTIIVGGGISGLTAAYYLQKAGKDYCILESTDRIGGRVKTDHLEGYNLDHGFQVFLTAYPEAKQVLDYSKLNLKAFDPGAILLRKEGKIDYIGDPLRQFSSLIPTLSTNAASLTDKLKILKLKQQLRKKTIEEIFSNQDLPTKKVLRDEYGFSATMISDFLQPFYAGIFLESQLSTSRKMFDFVFKMFSEGQATIPALGMEEIPKQIASHLNPSKIKYHSKVSHIEGKTVYLENQEKIFADHILIATNALGISSKYTKTIKEYHSTTNIYFSSDTQPFKRNAIALNGNPNHLVNNLVCLSKNASSYSQKDELISVSLKKPIQPNGSNGIEAVKSELSQWIPTAENWNHVKTYQIEYALPNQDKINNDTIITVNPNTTIIGDHVMNGSINAAMKSGRLGAERVISLL